MHLLQLFTDFHGLTLGLQASFKQKDPVYPVPSSLASYGPTVQAHNPRERHLLALETGLWGDLCCHQLSWQDDRTSLMRPAGTSIATKGLAGPSTHAWKWLHTFHDMLFFVAGLACLHACLPQSNELLTGPAKPSPETSSVFELLQCRLPSWPAAQCDACDGGPVWMLSLTTSIFMKPSQNNSESLEKFLAAKKSP